MLSALLSVMLLSGEEAIHPPKRVFTPSQVQSKLGYKVPGLLDELAHQIAKDPKQVAQLLETAQKLFPRGKLPLDPSKLPPSIKDFAQRVAENPELREKLLGNPEVQRAVKQFADKLPEESRRTFTKMAEEIARRDADVTLENSGTRFQRLSDELSRAWTARTRRDDEVGAEGSAPLSVDPEQLTNADGSTSEASAAGMTGEAPNSEGGPPSFFDSPGVEQPWSSRANPAGVVDRSKNASGRQRLGGESNPAGRLFSSLSANLRLEQWMKRIRSTDRYFRSLLETPIGRIPRWSLPGRETLSLDVPRWSMPRSVSLPSGFSALERGATPMLGIASVVMVLVTVWVILRGKARLGIAGAYKGRYKRRRGALGGGTLRDRVIDLFETSALVVLGDRAAAWHHRHIALEWTRKRPLARSAAQTFADLYEVARYSPPSLPFAESDLAAAQTLSRAVAESSSGEKVAGVGAVPILTSTRITTVDGT